MALSDYVNTFGQWLLSRYRERVHKVSIDAAFTCPNRDGTKGIGGCTFCNNSSFSPNAAPSSGRSRSIAAARPREEPAGLKPVAQQLAAGQAVIGRRTGAGKFLAYFQAYTNTYADAEYLRGLYDEALSHPRVIGLSVGTRPDCVPEPVLDLLAGYREQGKEVWLELGLQSAFVQTLERVNRGHGFVEYQQTVRAARERGLPVCTHLILGLPGETPWHSRVTLERVLEEGVDGLKLHPLHVVKGTMLANQWRAGEYVPWGFDEYVRAAADLIERTPPDVVYHRVTGTASLDILLAPSWCNWKWRVLNGIEAELARRGSRQGARQGVELEWAAQTGVGP